MNAEARQQSQISRASKLGTRLVPIGALVAGLAFTSVLTSPDTDTDPTGAAEFATGVFGYSTGMLYILATIALLLGLVALYERLSRSVAGGWALAGLVTGVMSLGLLLAADGVFIFAAAAVGELVLDGNVAAGDVLAKLSGGDFDWPIMIPFLTAIVLALAAGIAYAVAMWRSAVFPKWAAILLCVGLMFFATSTPVIGQLGSLMLVVAGITIARATAHVSEQARATVAPAQAR